VRIVGGDDLACEQHSDREPGEHNHPVASVALGPFLAEQALAFDEDEGAADGQCRACSGEVQVFPAQSEGLADTSAGGEHEVDDVGQVAGISGSSTDPRAHT
jgi:hypothetical protein